MMVATASLSFFSPLAIIAIPIFIIGVAIFGTDAICNSIGLDPVLSMEIPVIKDFPRFNPQDPDNTDWVALCYQKILDAHREGGKGLFTGNYMYPYLDLNKLLGHYAITKTYFGIYDRDMVLEEYVCNLDSEISEKMNRVFRNNDLIPRMQKIFTVMGLVEIDINNPKSLDEVNFIRWYQSWSENPDLSYLKQLLVSPLDSDTIKIVNICVSDRYTSHKFSNFELCSVGINTAFRGEFWYDWTEEKITPSDPFDFVVTNFIAELSKELNLPIQEGFTLFSSTVIHDPNNYTCYILSKSYFNLHEFYGFTEASRLFEVWPWPNVEEIRPFYTRYSDELELIRSTSIYQGPFAAPIRTTELTDFGRWCGDEYQRYINAGYDLTEPSGNAQPSSLPFFIMVALMVIAVTTY